MEIDENTRYGRTIYPLLKLRDSNETVFLHAYSVVRRLVTPTRSYFIWESVASDDLYPMETGETAIRNDEIGAVIMESDYLPNGQVRTLSRSVMHCTPPIDAITEPRGKLNESFLTAVCRSTEVLEASARKLLMAKHAPRQIQDAPRSS